MRIGFISGAGALLLCSLGLGSSATAKDQRLSTYLATFGSTYETADLPAHHDLSRLDFYRVRAASRGVPFRFSPISATEAERARSESGGIGRFVDGFDYAGSDLLMLQYPKAGITTWNVRWGSSTAGCNSQPKGEGKMLITCVKVQTGTTYASLYSAKRGFEWFDQPCSSKICRYVLTSREGIFSSRMDAELRRQRLFNDEPGPIIVLNGIDP